MTFCRVYSEASHFKTERFPLFRIPIHMMRGAAGQMRRFLALAGCAKHSNFWRRNSRIRTMESDATIHKRSEEAVAESKDSAAFREIESARIDSTDSEISKAPSLALRLRSSFISTIPQLPPWRSSQEDNPAIWHPGVTTSQMLDELAMSKKQQEDPPELALHFLKKLDTGELTMDDLGGVCAAALAGTPLYWRSTPAWTSTVDGSEVVHFADPNTIRIALQLCLEDAVSEWQNQLHTEYPDYKAELLDAFVLTGEFLYTFINIHPFTDGNGRSSRWMAGWMLWRKLGFKVKLPGPNEATRYSMSRMEISRYLMLSSLQQQDSSLFVAFLVDCAWSQLHRDTDDA